MLTSDSAERNFTRPNEWNDPNWKEWITTPSFISSMSKNVDCFKFRTATQVNINHWKSSYLGQCYGWRDFESNKNGQEETLHSPAHMIQSTKNEHSLWIFVGLFCLLSELKISGLVHWIRIVESYFNILHLQGRSQLTLKSQRWQSSISLESREYLLIL